MKISELNRRVTIQKLKTSSSFFDDQVVVEEEFSVYARVIDKGVTETDGNGHVHEAREMLFTMRSFKKTKAIRPDLFQLIYMEEIYDITHVELDSASDEIVTVHARRKSHASSRSSSSS